MREEDVTSGHVESRVSEAGEQQSTTQAPLAARDRKQLHEFLNNVAYMYMMSEFRAHYICTNLNNLKANIRREVMKPGNPALTSLGFQ